MKTSTFLKRSVIIGALAAAAIGGSVLAQDDRPYLGVTFTGVETGVRVTGVLPGSPADAAEVELGDVVTAINGDTISADTITDVLDDYNAGDTITLTLERDGAPIELEVLLSERPATMIQVEPPIVRRTFLGVQLEDTDDGAKVVTVVEEPPLACKPTTSLPASMKRLSPRPVSWLKRCRRSTPAIP
jgi:predicted metalloprotease with PDZ domain